jgi:RNA polymerase sigma-70 factor (ECF subfamily)
MRRSSAIVRTTEEVRIGEETWDAVYRRVAPRLAAYCSRRLPPGEADDAVSETVARAVAAAPRYRDRGLGVDAWLFGICRNVVLDTQRRAARRGSARGAAAVAGTWSPDAPGPLDAMLGAEEAVLLRRAFALLSEDDREVLELRVVAGLDAEAVASVLGKKPGAVRMAQSRALARLRSLLDEVDG